MEKKMKHEMETAIISGFGELGIPKLGVPFWVSL